MMFPGSGQALLSFCGMQHLLPDERPVSSLYLSHTASVGAMVDQLEVGHGR